MKRAHAIRHVDFEDAGFFADVLRAHDYTVSYRSAARDFLADLEGAGTDLLIVLGGPISVNDDQDFPFIEEELRVLRARLQQDRPTLGICLGAQLMARALSGCVYAGPEKEIGWAPLKLTAEGQKHPLRHLHAEFTKVFHWHGETFELPRGAVRLASTDRYVEQAFSWQRRGLALQFHPEVTAAGLESWYIGHVAELRATARLAIPQLRAASAQHEAALRTQAQRFFEEWLALINND